MQEMLEDRRLLTGYVGVYGGSNATEGDTGVNGFYINYSGDSQVNLSLTYTGTATNGADYSAASGVVLPSGSGSAFIAVTPVDDTLAESTETITINLNPNDLPSGYSLMSGSGTINLYDNDGSGSSGGGGGTPSTADVWISGYAPTTEGSGTAGSFTLSRSGGTISNSLPVNIALGGAAQSGIDYTAVSSPVTFAANATQLTVTIASINDTLVEGTEDVILSVGSGSGYASTSMSSASLSIFDNDVAPPSVSVQATDGSSWEQGPDRGAFTITRSYSSAAALDVKFTLPSSGTSISGGTRADAANDYTVNVYVFDPMTQSYTTTYQALTPDGSGNYTVRIESNQSSVQVFIVPTDDAYVEGTEMVDLILQAGTGYSVNPTYPQAYGTLNDNDVLPEVSVTASTPQTAEGSGTPGVFTFTRTGTQGNLTVSFTISGTAVNGSDYTTIPLSVTFIGTHPTETIDISAINDAFDEPAKTVIVTLATNATFYTLGTQNTATVTIDDNDDPVVNIDDAPAANEPVTAGGTLSRFRVWLSNPSTSTVYVDYYTQNSSPVSATGGDDYTISSSQVIFQPGDVEEFVEIPLLPDTTPESNETFRVVLSNPLGATIGDGTADGVITDIPPTISIADAAATTEGNPNDGGAVPKATFVVTLSAPSTRTITVAYTTYENGLSPAASSGQFDYTAKSGTLTFMPLDISEEIEVEIGRDLVDEFDEKFGVQLSNPTNATLLDSAGTATIVDDDAAPEVSIVATADVAEGTGGAGPHLELGVSLSYTSGKTVVVNYHTADGSATVADSDYIPVTSGTLTLNAGTSFGLIKINISPDAKDETDENIRVFLDNASNAVLGSAVLGVGTITDDDSLVAPNSQTSKEGATVSLSLSGNSSNYSANGGIYEITGLPNGLIYSTTTGAITGKVAYDAAAPQSFTTYNVAVSLKNAAGALLSATSFPWTINDAYILGLTAVELYSGSATSNSVTSFGGNRDLYVADSNTVRLSVGTATSLPSDLSDVLYSVAGSVSGNFSSTVVVTPLVGNTTYIDAGIDLNDDGVLGFNERTHSITVTHILFDGGVDFKARRSAGPASESTHYSIRVGDHFEVGGTFEFVIAPKPGSNFGNPSLLRWELIETEGMNQTVAEGAGLTFSHTFAAGIEEGNMKVRVYCDTNGDGVRNFFSETAVDSNLFWVQKRKVYNIAVDVSNALPVAVFNAVAARFDLAEQLLMRQDGSDDYRAAVDFVATPSWFTPTATRPNVVNSTPATFISDRKDHYDAPSDFVIVEDMLGVYGLTNGSWHESILEWQAGADEMAELIAHEFGHGVGLAADIPHTNPETGQPYAPPFVMTGAGALGGNHWITKTDRDAYDQ